MDQDVAQTLAALERKLADLERELTQINRDGPSPEQQRSAPAAGVFAAGAAEQRPSPAAGVFADEAVEQRSAPGGGGIVDEAVEQRLAPAAGVLVDEAVEQRFSMEAQETVFGEIPATKDDRHSIDVADLVRFKEKMQATLQGLIDEYSSLLSLKPPSDV